MRRWRYYLIGSDQRVVTKRMCPEKIGISWKARDGMKIVSLVPFVTERLRIRKSGYDFDDGEVIPNGELVELEIDEALKTGLNIDEWSSK